MYDLDYVKNQEAYDQQIQQSHTLIQLDDGFKETYIDVIQRFYLLFESIYNYYTSVTTFLNDVNDGRFVEFSLDIIL